VLHEPLAHPPQRARHLRPGRHPGEPQASYPALVPRGRQDAARSLADGDGDGDRDRDRDGTFLFITNKPFGIQHIFGED